jgi:hypothetical protein
MKEKVSKFIGELVARTIIVGLILWGCVVAIGTVFSSVFIIYIAVSEGW